MTWYFAYGSNMSRALMHARCPGARAFGTATLAGWRFIITADGYGSIAPQAGTVVHGVLWRLGPRDVAAINAYESVDSGLYTRRVLPVRCGARLRPALVYVAPKGGAGTPRPAYIQLVIEAAGEWELPRRYVHSLQRWAPSGWRGARAKDTGEVG
jgi:hypothetical protein